LKIIVQINSPWPWRWVNAKHTSYAHANQRFIYTSAIQGQHLFTRYQTTEQLDARKHLNASAQWALWSLPAANCSKEENSSKVLAPIPISSTLVSQHFKRHSIFHWPFYFKDTTQRHLVRRFPASPWCQSPQDCINPCLCAVKFRKS